MIDPRLKKAHDLWLQLCEREMADVVITLKSGKQIRGVVGETTMDVTQQWRDPAYVVAIYDRDSGEELAINTMDVEGIAESTS